MTCLLCLTLMLAQSEHVFLPKWMTPEESLRIDEIGKGHVVTAPPGGWVETPAEFEPLRGVWVTWEWYYYNTIFLGIVREVAEVCKVWIITDASDTTNIKNYLVSNGVPLESVRCYIYPYDAIWIRDYGPWFIRKQDNTEGIVDFQYNRPRPLDDNIPWRIGADWGIPVYGSPLEHAGGNFMVDGLGTGFASTLIYEENPLYSPQQIDSLMLAYNGLEQFIVLPRINIEYTGHIDLWTKILNDTLIMVGEYAPGHPNHNLLDQNADSLSRCKNREGYNYRIVRMPMPYSLSDAPPTYLNSLIVNNKVLVPIWGLAEDDTALFIYQQVFPGYEIIGINCSVMSGSGGAIHCITMQVPSSQYLHITHYPLTDTNDTLNPYRVRAQIITSSSLLAESTLIFYKINSDSLFNAIPLAEVADTPGIYAGYIPSQAMGDTVYYYLLAENIEDIRKTSPVDVPAHIYSFRITEVSIAEANMQFIANFMAYPNPARTKLNFSVNLAEPAKIKIEIYNALGQRVKILNGVVGNGKNTIQWNFCDDTNRQLASGAYFYRVIIDNKQITGKLLLIR